MQVGACSAKAWSPNQRLRQQLACLIIFVCTGNTCRSPLAEVLCKKLLADRLACTPEELPGHGFCVFSAGLAAMIGCGAATEAIDVARTLGADLSGHQSRLLTRELAAQADYLVAMTHSQELILTSCFADLGATPRLLSPAGEDIADPIGCDRPVYEQCCASDLAASGMPR